MPVTVEDLREAMPESGIVDVQWTMQTFGLKDAAARKLLDDASRSGLVSRSTAGKRYVWKAGQEVSAPTLSPGEVALAVGLAGQTLALVDEFIRDVKQDPTRARGRAAIARARIDAILAIFPPE